MYARSGETAALTRVNEPSHDQDIHNQGDDGQTPENKTEDSFEVLGLWVFTLLLAIIDRSYDV